MSHDAFRLSNPVHLLALGFGSGLLKPAPGTWGTLAAVPLFALLTFLPFGVYCGFVTLAFILGCFICGKASLDSGTHDHSAIVFDEFVGLWVTYGILVYLGLTTLQHLPWITLGFVLFRLFDILKPFPIGLLDKKIHGGVGIMLDDLVAGLYAMLALWASIEWYKSYLGI